ncbi:MAG TPA: hypothetical protein VGE93_09120 [Bryobacteraceae bacterium]
MERINSAVQHVTEIMDEIGTASHEQTRRFERVNQAIGQMYEVTRQYAALVEQAAAAAKSLDDQAEQLRSAIAAFKT